MVKSTISSSTLSLNWKSLILLLLVIPFFEGASQVLLDEDFAGATLDATTWDVAVNTIGRTQFGLTPTLAGGVATFRFDTHNAGDPGNTFKGTEIKTDAQFTRNGTEVLEFEARLRIVSPMANGLVNAFFTFDAAGGPTDEIDFELLSNWINNPAAAGRILLATWDDFDEGNPQPQQNFTTSALVKNFDPFSFNDYKMIWYADRTEWYVNDILIYSTTETLPDDPMKVHLNIWAPKSSFAVAFSNTLQPVANIGDNTSYTYEVESVTVTKIAAPPTVPTLSEWGIITLTVGLAFAAFFKVRRYQFGALET
jgi:hypothetical protein